MRKKDDDLRAHRRISPRVAQNPDATGVANAMRAGGAPARGRGQADVEEDHTFQLFAAIPYLAT